MTWVGVGILCWCTYLLWIVLATVALAFRHDGCRSVAAELRPFVLPAILLGTAANVATAGPPQLTVVESITLVVWWTWRDDDDDDRWKRRRHRVAARIRQAASGRLVVEPAPT